MWFHRVVNDTDSVVYPDVYVTNGTCPGQQPLLM